MELLLATGKITHEIEVPSLCPIRGLPGRMRQKGWDQAQVEIEEQGAMIKHSLPADAKTVAREFPPRCWCIVVFSEGQVTRPLAEHPRGGGIQCGGEWVQNGVVDPGDAWIRGGSPGGSELIPGENQGVHETPGTGYDRGSTADPPEDRNAKVAACPKIDFLFASGTASQDHEGRLGFPNPQGSGSHFPPFQLGEQEFVRGQVEFRIAKGLFQNPHA